MGAVAAGDLGQHEQFQRRRALRAVLGGEATQEAFGPVHRRRRVALIERQGRPPEQREVAPSVRNGWDSAFERLDQFELRGNREVMTAI